MSNKLKDWIKDLRAAPIGTIDHNRWLCFKYPWLLPRNRWTDKEIEDYDYSWTELDAMPEGWREAFGEQMCEEIQKVLDKVEYTNNYRILQIKEKWGYLHWYSNGVPAEIKEEYTGIIRKYEKLSERTCLHCGAPATLVSTGWISPWCDKCAEEIHDHFEPIEAWLKQEEEPLVEGGPFMISIEPI